MNEKISVNTIIFDLDGTLIDSAATIAIILNGMREQVGYEPLDICFYKENISYGAGRLVAKALEVELGLVESHLVEFRHQYSRLKTPADTLYPGVRETLSQLRNNNLKLAICSNKPEHLCRKIINETGMAELVDIVVGGDTLTECKPSPEPLRYIISLLAVDHRSSLMIGDSSIDQKAAFAADIPFVFFKQGYDDGVDQSKAAIVINQLPELLDHINATPAMIN